VPIRLESVHLGDLKVLVTDVFEDERGFFMEAFRSDYAQALGLPSTFPQENHSCSRKGVLRGLHFQWDPPMGKLVRITRGTAFVAMADIRRGSPTFGGWFGMEISADSRKQIWVPPGFANGFCALSDSVEVQYKCTALYNKLAEGGIRWSDPDIGIQWPIRQPILSPKDASAPSLKEWMATPHADCFTFSR